MELDKTQPIEAVQNYVQEPDKDQQQEQPQKPAPEEVKKEAAPEENNNSFFDGVESKSFNSIDDEIEFLKNEPKEGEDELLKEDSFTKGSDFDKSTDSFTDGFSGSESTKKNAKKNANLFARWFDTAFAFFLSWFASEEDFTKFKAEPKSLKVIEDSLENGLGTMDRDIEVPWYLGLVIEVPVAYFPKIKMAMRLRKLNRKNNKPKQPVNRAEPTQQNANNYNTENDFDHVEIINETPPKKGKILKPCPECGKLHKNKQYCSTKCRLDGLNKKKNG